MLLSERERSVSLRLTRNPSATTRRQGNCNDGRPGRCIGFANLSTGFLRHLATMVGDSRFPTGDVFFVPNAESSRSAQGFAWLGREDEEIACPVGTIPLQRHEHITNLWLPLDAEITPSLGSKELEEKIPSNFSALLWLPQLGLIGFETQDRVQPVDWLSTPVASNDSHWQPPPWTPPIHDRLTQLSMQRPPETNELLQQIADEVGKPAWSLIDADADGEKSSPSKRRRMADWFLKKLDGLSKRWRKDPADEELERAKKPPEQPNRETTGGKGWLSKSLGSIGSAVGGSIGSAAGAVAGGAAMLLAAPFAALAAKSLQSKRESQVDKLLDMMKRDPDRALQFAIPLGGWGKAFRGFALPGSQLISSLTDFSLGRLAMGGPVDAWSIGATHQMKLRQSYLAQAEREMAAGRYRRAAYVYAHLLSEFSLAADALRKGKHFEEAAALYQDPLKRPLDAAACLVEGGRIAEAVKIYEGIPDHVAAGEAWRDAGETELASHCYERAVQHCLLHLDVREAAVLMRERLQQSDRAIKLLVDQWRDGADALPSAELAVNWMIEDGRRDDARQRIMACMEDLPEERRIMAALWMSRLAKSSSDELQSLAADQCRTVVAGCLMESDVADDAVDSESIAPNWYAPNRDEVATLMRAVAALDHTDRQLNQDCRDFQRRFRHSAAPSGLLTRNIKGLQLIDTIAMPGGGSFSSVVVSGDWLIALKEVERKFYMSYRTIGTDESQIGMLGGFTTGPRAWEDVGIFFGSVRRAPDAIEIMVFANVEEERRYSSGQRKPGEESFALWVRPDNDVHAACWNRQGEFWWIEKEDNLPVAVRGPAGQRFELGVAVADLMENDLLAGLMQTEHLFDDAGLTYVDGALVVRIEAALFCSRSNKNANQLDRLQPLELLHVVARSIRSLTPSPEATLPRVLVSTESGLYVVKLDGECTEIDADHDYRLAEFMSGGTVVAITGNTLKAFRCKNSVYRELGEHPLRPDKACIALLRLRPNVVGAAYADGSIERIRVQQR